MENVPLFDAIGNLAEQLEINYIVDPRLCRHGWPATNPPITARWKISPQDALQKLLKEHDMKIVTNSITSVSTILRAVDTPNRAPELSTVIPKKTVMPLMKGDGNLDEVIAEWAGKTGMTIQINPDLEIQATPEPVKLHDYYIYFRWRDITPEQALAALLGNFRLRVEKSSNGILRVTTADSL
jgi:hypothetical protein